MFVHTMKLSLGPALLLVLGGCTTYGAQRPTFAYFAVPCSTPGAFVAEPIYPPGSRDGPDNAVPTPPSPTVSADPNSAPPPTCMIAAPISQAGYYGGRGYYSPYYYGYGRYGAPFMSSFGIGFRGGGHGGYGGHGGGHGGHGGHGSH